MKLGIGNQWRLHAVIIIKALAEIDVISRIHGEAVAERDAGSKVLRCSRRAEAGFQQDRIGCKNILAKARGGALKSRFGQGCGGWC